MKAARESITRAAMSHFAKKGYAGSSIREICAAAGVTKPVLYYYFRGKEHLYDELMIDSFNHYLKILLNASRKTGSVRERLVRVARNDLDSVKADPIRSQFLMRMIFSPESRRPNFDYVKEMERQRQVFADVFQDGINAGELQGSARELATALMGLDLIAILENLFTGRSTLNRRTAARHVDLLLKGCCIR
jgi:TetR/AcrR family transcriptional regulator